MAGQKAMDFTIEHHGTVVDEGCDLGIAFDGDGDRIGVVDGKGRVLWGDRS